MSASENRRSRRIMVHGEVDGTAGTAFRASVVNLSHEGVCLEHAGQLDTEKPYELRFRIPPMTFAVRARIVWSRAHGPEGGSGGRAGLFRSGAEFLSLSEDAVAAINAIVPRPAPPKSDGPPEA